MESEPPPLYFSSLILFASDGVADVNLLFLFLALLIISSGLISASEVAYFSLNINDIKSLEEMNSENSRKALLLKDRPRYLLATILIGNNFVNIAIVVVADIIIRNLLGAEKLFETGMWLHRNLFFGFFTPDILATAFNFFITVICVTFILVLFGEAMPKIYASVNKMKIILLMSGPLSFMKLLFTPLSSVLVNWSGLLERKLGKTNSQITSKEDIDAAIDLTVVRNNEKDNQEAGILKGIVNFGDISARQIMRPRMDIIAVEENMSFKELMKIVKDSGYSRLPVYNEDFDNIIGILYVKDLIAHTESPENFDWKPLVRNNVLFVPESKKIDELLREFQSKRTHMAIIVDEYGGTAGIATLEDIMEEVVGDIKDEFDVDEDIDYIKISENNFIFEGKTLLKDVCRVIGENTNYFDELRDEADTLAGLILEITGSIPKPEKEITVGRLTLKVISVTKKRIEKISVIINSNPSE
ncbi:MAG: gliding motility-associated protein GldE [Saprospiraceae bacterium]|nr:gliding motility-associated protein GldE [Saprospiraceae bacterium]